MQKLIDSAKGQPRVFVRLNSPHEKAVFLKRAAEEGFLLGGRLPSECRCDDVMIIHDDYTVSYCVGTSTNWLYHYGGAKIIDFASFIENP